MFCIVLYVLYVCILLYMLTSTHTNFQTPPFKQPQPSPVLVYFFQQENLVFHQQIKSNRTQSNRICLKPISNRKLSKSVQNKRVFRFSVNRTFFRLHFNWRFSTDKFLCLQSFLNSSSFLTVHHWYLIK